MMENKTKIDLKNKSVFITGVAGFIGSNLAKRLLSTVEGVKVVGLDNMNNYYDVRLKEARLKELEQFEKFSFVKGNLADPMSFKVPDRLLTDGQCRMRINGVQFVQALLEANGLAAGKDYQFKGRYEAEKNAVIISLEKDEREC